MQTKVGYVEIGRIPDKYWKRGRYLGAVQTYLTREGFEAKLASPDK